MIVVSFGDERRAGQVLDTQKQMQDAAVIDLKNSTVAVRDATGKVTLKNSDFEIKQDALAGRWPAACWAYLEEEHSK